MVEKWVLCTGKVFSSVPVLLVALIAFRLVLFCSSSSVHTSSFPGFLSSSDHILQREYSLPQVYWTKKNKTNNDNNVLLFVFIIPHSYKVSVWKKASGRRHRAGRRLGILLGGRQERSDPRVSGQGSVLSWRSPGSALSQAPSLW